MRELFPPRKEKKEEDGRIEKCNKFLHRHCHPMQIGTGLLFSAVGIGVTAVGIMYADGLNFLAQSIPQIPNYIAGGANAGNPIDYIRESYRGSMSEALDIGWKQAPFSYSIGHYLGGKVRDKLSKIFGR